MMMITMKKNIFLFVISLAVAAGCKQISGKAEGGSAMTPFLEKRSSVRYGMVTGVRPEKLDYYRALHAKPWPAVLAKIKECNIENYSIYLQKIEDKYFLFSYFEYKGRDFDADMKKMAADTATQRWWRETDPCQLPLPEAVAKKQIWTKMVEVFYTK
jgi:L-rhamnose mutarotase